MEPEVHWQKSSYSGGEGGDCIECGQLAHAVLVRDSKDPNGPVLTFSSESWKAFISSVQANHFPAAN
ncbi:DUF397 domain-containing protein [Kitasatospora sp. NPDC097643]|uniref:DUF397 domain-containing protein n=1 Tax=Kitasatospora sp. NPDC097643 TaxID=3157230 RepID=UPI00331AB21C